MSSRFSWQTDDDRDWSEPDDRPRRPRLSRRLWTVLLVLSLAAAALLAVYQFGQRRLAQREAAIRSEVMAAHTTWRAAAERGDIELLLTLSARDETDWTSAQRQLLLAGQLLDRSALGLRAAPGDPAPPSISLSPDQTTAELRFAQPYTDVATGRTVTLEQTAVYRRAGPTWLQRPLTADEWGPMQERANQQLIATFPQRDADVVNRLALDLSRDLGDLCREAEEGGRASRLCDPQGRIRLAFLTDPAALLALSDAARPSLDGLTFRLPTPTLAGRPLDDAGYALLYRGYTDRILTTLRQLVSQPIPLPPQDIAALCHTSASSRLSLAFYRPEDDDWLLPDEPPARTLWPLPNDDGLILRAGLPGIDLDRLQLSLRRDGVRQPLVDVGQPQLTASLAGFVDNTNGGGLLIRLGQGSSGVAGYAWAPFVACTPEGCATVDLSGYPVWSPDGRRTLVSDGGRLLLGDAQARLSTALGNGFSPFWLSNTRFGYVALAAGDSPDMRLMLQDALTRERAVIGGSRSLMQAAGADDRLRIRYATTSPADPSLLLIGATPAGNSDGEYLIFGQRLSDSPDALSEAVAEPARVLARLPGVPVGDPARYTPTGSPPFNVSPDGRWLVAVRFAAAATNAWELTLVDLTTGETKTLTTNHPPYPAQFPFFDWSADGRWLVLVDDGYLRLIAPDHDYERVVAHEFRTCRHVAWVNR